MILYANYGRPPPAFENNNNINTPHRTVRQDGSCFGLGTAIVNLFSRLIHFYSSVLLYAYALRIYIYI